CDPELPATAFNRLADNWRPLLAIAEVAGGDWPRLALESFNHLTSHPTPSVPHVTPDTRHLTPSSTTAFQMKPKDEDLGVKLLADIQQIFTQTRATRLFSKQLVEALRAIPLSAPGGE